jgi:hypothetical protein
MWMHRAGYLVLILLALSGGWAMWNSVGGQSEPSGMVLPERSLPERAMEKSPQGRIETVTDMPDICEETVFENARAILCVADPSVHSVRLAYRGRMARCWAAWRRR